MINSIANKAIDGPIRVGFGPITKMNSFFQSGENVARVLGEDSRFTCGFFHWEPFSLYELLQYDVLIFIKYFPSSDMLQKIKRQGKKLILDYHDMFLYPSVYETNRIKKCLKKLYYYKNEIGTRRQLRHFDLCFIASPLLVSIVEEAGIKPFFLHRQLFNQKNEFMQKCHNDRTDGVFIYWTGVTVNQPQNVPILPVLKKLHDDCGCRIVFSTDSIGKESFIEYRIWNRDMWEDELLEADIAFRWRDTSNLQHCKDANKVLAYMGAGLPVVIYPTESEKIVVQDGVTGFFAYSPERFERTMLKLIKDPPLRERVGRAAHTEVWSKYSLRHHVEEIKSVVINLVGSV